MIHANELRLGNLVEYDNRTFAIDSISQEFPTLSTSEFGIGVVDYNNISPIPLTEEWLVKFGFQDYENSYILEYDGRDFTWTGSTYYIRWCGHAMDCQYVHQLQNLYFALTGNELTINEG